MPVQEIIDLAQFQRDIAINPVDIQSAYMDQASLYAYYAGLLLKAERQTGNFKIVRDTCAARIDQEIRANAAQDIADQLALDAKAKVERITETGVMSKRNIDPRYINAVKEHIDAEAIETFIKNALGALQQRRDMLISLGSTMRQEALGDMRMMARAGDNTNLQEGARAAYDRLNAAKGEVPQGDIQH
jgi:hypothetical protein